MFILIIQLDYSCHSCLLCPLYYWHNTSSSSFVKSPWYLLVRKNSKRQEARFSQLFQDFLVHVIQTIRLNMYIYSRRFLPFSGASSGLKKHFIVLIWYIYNILLLPNYRTLIFLEHSCLFFIIVNNLPSVANYELLLSTEFYFLP